MAPKKKAAPKKKKAGAKKLALAPQRAIVAGMFSVVCDINGVIGTFADRASANACKSEHLQQFADHNVVVEGVQA